MWFTGIVLEDGRWIEAQYRAERWRWRLCARGGAGPNGAPLGPERGQASDSLARLIDQVAEHEPVTVRVAVLRPLAEALELLSIEDERLLPWRLLLDRERPRALALRRGCIALRDLLQLASERMVGADDEPTITPGSKGNDDPVLQHLAQRIWHVLVGVDWGEPETRRETRAMTDANYHAALFAFRQQHVDRLPFEDLDALLADRETLIPRPDGRRHLTVDLDRLLQLRARLTELASDGLSSPPGDAIVVATGRERARTYALVRDDRRWGLSADGDEPLSLSCGLGIALAQRITALAALPAADARVMALHRDAIALADATRLGASPEAGLTVLVHGGREVQARWRRGGWQWRARNLVQRDGTWVRGRRKTSWRRGAASLLPIDLRTRYVPIYLHPVIAPHVADALALERLVFGDRPYEDRAWDALLDEARAGRIAGLEGDPYNPSWVLATDMPYEIELGGRVWSSIDAAVGDALARPGGGITRAKEMLIAALELKHREEFVPFMVLRETGEAPLHVPSRWDSALGDNVVGELLMQLRSRLAQKENDRE